MEDWEDGEEGVRVELPVVVPHHVQQGKEDVEAVTAVEGNLRWGGMGEGWGLRI